MLRHLKQVILTTLFALFASQASAMFIQPDWFDPTKQGVGTNRYSYCFNDPINCIDPSGNQALHDLDLTQEEADELNAFASAAAATQAAALEAEAATNSEIADLILNQAGKYRASSEVFQSRIGVSVG
ncbi:MAG: RHS repeat-associated core domain-containing protein [Pseudoruegeria sp.]